ncbi:MAG TPA: response regulator [Stellaceae bacterium]|jgi:signal transduction histidine kinase/CheY-like chemotaxis protein|nr:response regulator [Stellaceae bacterium]
MNGALYPRAEPALYGILALLAAATFTADLFVPLGTSVWVIYLFTTALAYFVWRPQVPLIAAGATTLLVIVGYVFADKGIDPHVSRINRSFCIITAWVIGTTGYFFIRSKLARRRQEWLQAGAVGLAQAMSGELRLDQLGGNILRFLAEHLGAQAGALFFQDGDAFRRHATYGVPPDAPVPERFQTGEGLLGQAVKDGRSFVLQDVPDGQLYFGSALGQGKPRHLLIAPAKSEGEINAALELGFIGQSGTSHAELLETVGESIAVAVRSAKYRARLQELVEETQRQAEELRSQSDELRASNEELETHSRSLQESQVRLEAQQAELEQSNSQLEEQTQLLETQRDDLSRTQASMEAQARELEQASRYKSEFLANMSHELRTPLNALLIMARLLGDNRDGNLTSEQVRYAQTIETSGNDLLALINDILDISKIEAGHIELQPERVRIGAVIDKLTGTFGAAAEQKGLALRVVVAPEAPRDIETDPQRLEQVLKNFLSNAIKFTDRGEVVLSVERAGRDRIGFAVRDTGIGIPPDQQQTIFEPFRQADGSINRRYGGTGLGLSVSRELARLLIGEIHVDSEVGRGSIFTLVIPETYDAGLVQPRGDGAGRILARAAAPLPAATYRAGNVVPAVPRRRTDIEDDRERLTGDSRMILVVEDDAAFARVLFDLAHELGFQCLVSQTADEGVIMARQYLPHAIILDMNLPDHPGLSVLDRLKRDLRTRHIPVHVASVSDYAQTALSLGAVGYMLKPITRAKLVQALEQLETRLAQRMRRVLVVEDDAAQLESIQLLLGSRDVEAVGARTAAACLEKLRSETFDCMVLDLSLPDASGFELLEQLGQDEAFAFPPVIVYTGRELSPEEELQLRKFSKSVIIKGAKSPERLLDEVTLFLHQVVSELPEQQQRMLAKSLNRDATLEGRCILIVEDDVRNIFSLTSIFEPHGVTVLVARNGREALQALDRAPEGGAPPIDLVLMDVMMPEMDGLTATREIRSRPAWKQLPIITLTAKAMADDQEQCLAAGANDYLAKPLDVDKLLSLVRVWMPRRDWAGAKIG